MGDFGLDFGWAIRLSSSTIHHGERSFRCAYEGTRWQRVEAFFVLLARRINEEHDRLGFVYYEEIGRAGDKDGYQWGRIYGAFWGFMHKWAADQGRVPVRPITVAQHKKAATGYGRADKPEMIAWARGLGYEIGPKQHNRAEALSVLHCAMAQQRLPDAFQGPLFGRGAA